MQDIVSGSKALAPFNPGIPLSNYRIIPRSPVVADRLRSVAKAHKLTDPGWAQVFGSGKWSISEENFYKQHLWVYACINRISSNVGGVPYEVYKGDTEVPVDDEKDDCFRLFRDVNPHLSRYQLFEGTSIFLYGWGEAFWVLEKLGMPTVQEIWMFRPDHFKHVVKDGKLIGWVYDRGVKQVPLELDEVIHFRLFNPYDDIRGFNPMQVAKLTVETDYFAQKFNWNFFKQGATPGLSLTTEQALDDDQYDRVMAQWEQKYSGLSKSHSIAILDGGLKFDKMPITQRDMDFGGLRKMAREEVCAILGVPPAEVGILEYSRAFANTKSQDKGFWQKTLIPRMHYFEDILNTNFFPVHFPEHQGYFDLSVVEALQADLHEKAKTAKTFHTMGYPINVINESMGLGFPEINGGEFGYLPQNYIPVTAVKDAKKTVDKVREEIGEKITRRIVRPKRKYTKVGSLNTRKIEAMRVRYAEELRLEIESAKERIRDHLKGVFGYGKKMRTKGPKQYAPEVIEGIFSDWVKGWKEKGAEYLKEAFEFGLSSAEELMGDLLTSETFRETVLIQLTSKNDAFVQKRIDSILAQLASELSDIGWEGEGAASVAVDLLNRHTFRAETFANFVLSVAHHSFVAEGAERKYQGIWHTTGDGNECPTCEGMPSGNPWKLGEMTTLPGEDVICNGRCRCYVEIVNPEEGG